MSTMACRPAPSVSEDLLATRQQNLRLRSLDPVEQANSYSQGRGLRDGIAGHGEQASVGPSDESSLANHTISDPGVGKRSTLLVHHQHVDQAKPGITVGSNQPAGRELRLLSVVK